MSYPGSSSGGLPFITPDTSKFLKSVCASSSPSKPKAIKPLTSANAMAPSLAFDRIQITDPLTQANGVLSVGVDTRIKLLVCFRSGPLIQFLKIPKTPSVHGESPTPKQSLKFSLELKGNGSEIIIRNVCGECKERKSQATWDMVDFSAPTTIISIQDGTASIEFFIKCYARHHGKEHFRAYAVLRDYQDNVVDRTLLTCFFNISEAKPVKPIGAQQHTVRGMAAQHHDINLVVPPSIDSSAQDPQHVDNDTAHLGDPAGEYLQTSKSGQQPSWAGTAAGVPGATDSRPPSALASAPTLPQRAVQPSELRFGDPVMGTSRSADSLPLEDNSNPSGTGTRTSPNCEQILPVMPREVSSVLRVLKPTSGEPHFGRGMALSSRVPETTSQILSQNSSGIPRAFTTSSAVPSGQGCGAPGISIPSETSQLQVESPVNTRNEGINQITGDTRLEEVSPQRGPMTGGMGMVLFGENFPAFPLYVGFGDKWVRARWHDARVLRCCLPPSGRPGVVDVILSREHSNNAPEVGWSTATFEYEDTRAEALLSILKNIYQWANETIRQLRPAQSFAAMNTVRDPNLNTGTAYSNNQEREEIPPRLVDENIEDISIHFLCTCSTHPNWKQIVSSRNEYGQTMAHLCVTLGYFRLLQHLCTWEIDLNAMDNMGSTALHYAYLFRQEECAKLLIRSGANPFILDQLGRTPYAIPEPFAILELVDAIIPFTKELINAIDVDIGCLTKNTPSAALWFELLSGLKTEITHAQDQLHLVKDEVEPMRVKQGSGADAANHKRQDVKFDELIQELVLQLQASENVFLTAINQFKHQGRFDWALLEAFDGRTNDSTVPMKSHCEELKRIRWRVHEARQSILDAFIFNCHGSTGRQYRTRESFGDIRDKLAHGFLWPDPFCKKIDTENVLASELLLCNKDIHDLEALQKRIQELGFYWVHAVDHDTANRHSEKRYVDGDAAINCDQRHISTATMLEECRDKILVQLKSVFKAITTNRALFTPQDYANAWRGLKMLTDRSSICVAEEEGGVVIALGGKTGAGKSSIINAIVGQSLLPTGRLTCTAVPSRLRHVSGQIEPTLSIPWIDPYVKCLEWIKAQDLWTEYRCSLLPDRMNKWAIFVHQDPTGRALLAKIKANECPILKTEAKGGEAIDQMKFLNSLVRICLAFGEEVDMGYPNQWPILSVEFTGLEYCCQNLPCPFTLLDLPGYSDDIVEEPSRFTELMIRAARQADVVVPVIAIPAVIPGKKWSKCIIRPEWSTKISSVIISKRDLVGSSPSLRAIAKVCGIPGREDSILLCDVPQGTAAMQLYLLLDAIERKYATDPILPEATAELDKRLQQETAILIAGITDESNPFHRALEQLFERHSDPRYYATFTFNDWRKLVEKCLVSSQLRQTCDMFAVNAIEEARRRRLAPFIEEMEGTLYELVLSLSVTLGQDRASPSELYEDQFQKKKALSDLLHAFNQWTPRIDLVRAQQESKLNCVLREFERAAKDSVDRTIEELVASFHLDGKVYLLGKGAKAEIMLQTSHEMVLRRLEVDDAIRDLCELWMENQDAVLSLLRNATENIATHPQLADVIKSTIDELEKAKRLDLEKLGHYIRMKGATPAQVVEENKRTGLLSLLKHMFGYSEGSKAIESQSAPTTSAPVLPPSTPVAHPNVSVANETTTSASPETGFAGVALAALSVNMAERLRAIVFDLQGSFPTVQEAARIAVGNPSDNKHVDDQEPLRLTQEVLRKCLLVKCLDPLVSRVKAEAMSSMTESLNEMGALAQQAVLDALEGCFKDVEERMKTLEPEDTKQLRAERLERLVCWGNLVAAQGVIQAMKRMNNEPVTRVPPSRLSSSLA